MRNKLIRWILLITGVVLASDQLTFKTILGLILMFGLYIYGNRRTLELMIRDNKDVFKCIEIINGIIHK